MQKHETITLPNGVRILIEPDPHVRSVAVGIWVGAGSRHETPAQQGIAHFIEHMVFKGTARRTAAMQAMEMDRLGGQFNAYTTKEHTCYYAKVLDTHLPQALDLLFDLFYNAAFAPSDVASERNVILEEIGMYADTPEDLCIERLFSAVYRGNSLGHPILGLPSTLSRMTGSSLRQFRSARYLPEETVVCMVGRFRPEDVAALKDHCAEMQGTGRLSYAPAVYRPCVTVRNKQIEQNHLCFAFPALPLGHPRRFALNLLSSILGGNMSSLAFQELRERLGLCYSIYSFSATHLDTGLLCLYAALSPEAEDKAIAAICTLIARLLEDGVTEEELHRAKEQMKASIFLGMESVTARMNHLARSVLTGSPVLSEEELAAEYEAVTRADILDLAREVLQMQGASLSVVGRGKTKTHYRARLSGAAAH